MSEPKDTYGLDPDERDDHASQEEPSRHAPDLEPSAGIEPHSLETPAESDDSPIAKGRPVEKHSAYIDSLDTCPNCGAQMPGASVVCLRCGYNLKTMRVETPKVREVDSDEDDAGVEEGVTLGRPILSRPGMGDMWLPLALAGVAAIVMLYGYLSGAMGLFDAAAVETVDGVQKIPAGERLLGVLKFALRVSMLTVCSFAAVFGLAKLAEHEFGEWRLVLARVIGIALIMRLVAFIHFKSAVMEQTVELIAQAAVFCALSIVFFRLSPRDAVTLLGMLLLSLLGLWGLANLIVWVT